MSNDLMNLVWASDIQPLAKRVTMLALADAANSKCECWPKIEELVARVGAGRSTVIEALSRLEAEGLVTKRRRRGRATVYTVQRPALASRALRPPAPSEPADEPPAEGDDKPEGPDSIGPDSGPSENWTPVLLLGEGPDAGLPKVQPLDRTKGTPKEPPISCPPAARKRPTNPSRRKPKAKTPIPLSDDWAPTEKHRARAAEIGLDLNHQADLFRAHAETHERTVVNWNGAFSMWLSKATEYRSADPRSTPAHAGPMSADGALTYLRAEWTAGRVRDICKRTGLTFPTPDTPDHVRTREEIDGFLADARRQWITANHSQILDRLTRRTAS